MAILWRNLQILVAGTLATGKDSREIDFSRCRGGNAAQGIADYRTLASEPGAVTRQIQQTISIWQTGVRVCSVPVVVVLFHQRVDIAAAYHLWAWLISYRSSLPRIAAGASSRIPPYIPLCFACNYTERDVARLRRSSSQFVARGMASTGPILISAAHP